MSEVDIKSAVDEREAVNAAADNAEAKPSENAQMETQKQQSPEEVIAGLREALHKERLENRRLQSILRKIAPVEQEGQQDDELPKLRDALEKTQAELANREREALLLLSELTAERARNAVMKAASEAGVAHPDLIAQLALSADWYAELHIEDGIVKNAKDVVDAILNRYPALRGQAVGTPRQTVKPDVNERRTPFVRL